MAIKTWTINVAFTANQSGEHRLCWRIAGSPTYDCTTTVICVGGGTSCAAVVITSVNNTSCDGPITIEGYIQPTCEDIMSSSNRLAWNTTFTPNVICERYEVNCLKGGIDSIAINLKGSGYSPGDAVTVVRDPLDLEVSNGTVGIATVGNGVINSIAFMSSGGTGYTIGDVLTIVGSSGSGGTITVNSIGGAGIIASYTLTTGGTGYIGPFTFTGGTGSGVAFTILAVVNYQPFGSILTMTVGTPGLYDRPPTLSIAGSGAGANLDVKLTKCGVYALGTDCDSNALSIPSLSVGKTFAACVVGGITGQAGNYAVNQAGCCIPLDSPTPSCYFYTLINNMGGGVANIQYTTCEGGFDSFLMPVGGSATICAVEDGILNEETYFLTITKGTYCA